MDRVRGGDWPGWNPLQGAGADLASVPTYGLLAPTGLSWWLLPHSLAPAWEKLTILALATAGTALFLRRLRLARHAAWLGGMVYAASGFMIAWTNWPQAGVAAMLPWLLWSVERALQARTWRAHVPVSLTVGCLLLGGFPAVTAHGLYLAGGYVLLRLVTRGPAAGARVRDAVTDGARLLAAVVVGFLLAGVQLVHFVFTFAGWDTEHRADSFDRLIPLRMALTSLFPNAWGTRGGEGIFAGSGTNPIEANAYFGTAAAVLVVVALLVRPGPGVFRGVRTYFAVVVATGVLLIYVQGPLLEWVGMLPVFSGNPIGRLTAVVLLAAAVLAGIGFDAALQGRLLRGRPSESRWRRPRLLVAMATAFLLICGGGWWVSRQTAGLLDPGVQRTIVLVALGSAAVTVGAVLVATFRPARRAAVLAVVPVAVAVQAVTAAQPMWAQVDRASFYPSTPVHDFLLDHQGSNRIAVTGATMISGPTAYYGLRTAPGHVFATPEFNDLRRAACEPCLLTATNWVLPREPDADLWHSPILDRMGAQYLTVDPDQPVFGRQETVVTGDQDVDVPAGDAAPIGAVVPAGPLRAVVFDFRSGPPETSDGHLLVRILDEDGDPLAVTRHFVQYPRPPSILSVPIAGESIGAAGPLTVEISWSGSGPAPRLGADEGGRPALAVVRPEDDGLRLVHAEGAVIWERLDVLPRIHWASSSEVIPAAGDRIEALADGDVAPDTVVLDREDQPVDGRPATVDVLEDTGDRVRLRVDAEGAGYLVLAESIQVDWTATVDGKEMDIVDADHAFGAVRVEAGVHEVSFEYTPRGATAGVLLTTLGVIAVLAGLLPWRRRQQQEGRPSPT